jgi:Fe2+ or Zn2+ uptake regulation protein
MRYEEKLELRRMLNRMAMPDQVAYVKQLIQGTETFHCHCCGHVLESPKPSQIIDAMTATYGIDPALASISFRALVKDQTNASRTST